MEKWILHMKKTLVSLLLAFVLVMSSVAALAVDLPAIPEKYDLPISDGSVPQLTALDKQIMTKE